uniref:Uncharacterized protein n=1 Tax=virus sp. ctQ5V6 TaxID=2825815 RepID=A0A8S5RQR7_9VIRU|nr:MAG TPA: hypothetical protein [virus sp. ctQ5V6]
MTSATNAHTMEYKHILTAQVRPRMARSFQGFAGSAGSGSICARSRSTIYSCMNFHAILPATRCMIRLTVLRMC